MLRTLTFSHLRIHKVRTALSVAAIALAVSLVVTITCGYASLEASVLKFLCEFIGSVDAQVACVNESDRIPDSFLDSLRRDPAVKTTVGRFELTATGWPYRYDRTRIVGLRRPDDTEVDSLNLIAGNWFTGDTGNFAVIDQIVARSLNVKLGGEFPLTIGSNRLKFKVVGIFRKPDVMARRELTVYVPLQTLGQFAGPADPLPISRILIYLRHPGQTAEFAARWRPKTEVAQPALTLRMTREDRRQLDANLRGFRVLSYMGGTVAMLAAAFIVFASLSMGVTERIRTLAMLRAIGALRSQIGKIILLESLLLSTAGILLGIPLGMFWSRLLIEQHLGAFSAGLVTSWDGMLFGAAGATLTALLAGFLPAFSAMRISPLDAMTPLVREPKPRAPFLAALLGLLLIALDPLLVFGPFQGVFPLVGHCIVGLPGILIGFFLLAPLFISLGERLAGPLLAGVLRLRFALLRQQLSGGIWRSAGTCAALMVGLAVLVAMQVQGQSMLAGWRQPNRFPDLFIFSPLRALTPPQQEHLQQLKGLNPQEFFPIIITSPELGSSFFALATASLLPNATLFIGVDADKFMRMVDVEFREGDCPNALQQLRQNRHLIVTEEFRQARNLHVGDKLPLKTPRHGTVNYTIAAVVHCPGITMLATLADLSHQFQQRTTGAVFGTLADAKADFGIEDASLFAANLDSPFNRRQTLRRINSFPDVAGLENIRSRELTQNTRGIFQLLLAAAGTLAFTAMIIASLGVTNTIMAAIRSRRWQFGILRAVGMTRGQLLRMVLAESILLGLVACIMGLLAGLEMSLGARALGHSLLGYSPPVFIPWTILAIGSGMLMTISIAAGLIPALCAAKDPPLALLQAGRATM